MLKKCFAIEKVNLKVDFLNKADYYYYVKQVINELLSKRLKARRKI